MSDDRSIADLFQEAMVEMAGMNGAMEGLKADFGEEMSLFEWREEIRRTLRANLASATRMAILVAASARRRKS